MRIHELISENIDLSRDVKVGWDVAVQGLDPAEYFHCTVIDPWNPDTKVTKVKSLIRFTSGDPYPIIEVDGKTWRIVKIMQRLATPMTLDDLASRGYFDKITGKK